MKGLRIALIVLRIGLGGLFVYGGIQKFIPKPPRPQTEQTAEVPPHVAKIKAYIGGLKQTDYFWPMLGVVEIIGGVLLLSQFCALLGAVILVPVTLNIFFFHAFLEPHDTGELVMTALYLFGNIALIAWYYPRLKPIFLNLKTIY